ncbi:MAG: ABC transporter substrate-binding protein, partial [Magnetospirillum sp.]|nr:ABC transporter substrate-binding protein [Magnetospirillum sp.]
RVPREPFTTPSKVDKFSVTTTLSPTEQTEAFEARWNQEATIFAGHAYDAFTMVMAALRRTGTANKAELRDEIEKTKGFVGTGGIFTMTPTDHLGLDLGSFHMVEIRNGDWVLVD